MSDIDYSIVFGQGLLSMMEGVQEDMAAEEKTEAETTRVEGLARLKADVANENADSGWVDKDTGKSIKQSDLANTPMSNRSTSADYEIDKAKNKYIAQREYTAEERAEQSAADLAKEERGYAASLERTKLQQNELSSRNQDTIDARKETAAAKISLAEGKAASKASLAEEKATSKAKSASTKGSLTEKQTVDILEKAREKYADYVSEIPTKTEEGSGLLGTNIRGKKVPAEEKMSEKDYMKLSMPYEYELIYGKEEDDKKATTEDKTVPVVTSTGKTSAEKDTTKEDDPAAVAKAEKAEAAMNKLYTKKPDKKSLLDQQSTEQTAGLHANVAEATGKTEEEVASMEVWLIENMNKEDQDAYLKKTDEQKMVLLKRVAAMK